MQNAMININGKILSPENANISVFDRSFLYGDSLYEVVRSYHGEFFLLKEHLARLESSAELCHMKLNQNTESFRQEIYRTFQAFRQIPKNKKCEAYCRLVVSRGTGKIGFGLKNIESPTQYVIFIQPVEVPTPSEYENGVHLQISSRLRNDRRALDPAMKSGNYLNSLLAYLEATSEGFSDAILSNSEGHMTEGTTFNIFYVRRGILATPPLSVGILGGITRKFVLQLALELGIPVLEVRFPKERLYEADEVFLTSSVKEIQAITQLDHVKINHGKLGQITRQLHQTYRTRLPGKPRGEN